MWLGWISCVRSSYKINVVTEKRVVCFKLTAIKSHVIYCVVRWSDIVGLWSSTHPFRSELRYRESNCGVRIWLQTVINRNPLTFERVVRRVGVVDSSSSRDVDWTWMSNGWSWTRFGRFTCIGLQIISGDNVSFPCIAQVESNGSSLANYFDDLERACPFGTPFVGNLFRKSKLVFREFFCG